MNIMRTKNGRRPRLAGAGKQQLEVSLIGEDMEVVGSVHSSGVVKVAGTVLGDVSADTQLLVAKGGRVEGDVCAREVVLNGEVYKVLALSAAASRLGSPALMRAQECRVAGESGP